MKKTAYFVELLPDGVSVMRGPADGEGRPVLQDYPAITLVCDDENLARDLADIVVEGREWVKKLGIGVAIYVSGMGYELAGPPCRR